MLKPKASAATSDPGDPGPVQLREEELGEFAQSKAAQHLARLEGDKELVFQLMLRGYTGSAWRTFGNALVQYGLQVMKVWIANGRIFDQCKRKGRGIPGGRPPKGEDEVLSLAGMVVTVALNAFRDDVLVPGRWDPSRGASLRTFFIGQCVLRFPNEYRRWKPSFETAPIEGSSEHLTQPAASPSTIAALRLAWASMPPAAVGAMLGMVEMGYSHEEIANMIGVTKRSVDSKLYRAAQGQDRER